MSKKEQSAAIDGNAMLADVLIQEAKWVQKHFGNHQLLLVTNRGYEWSDDYSEIYLLTDELFGMQLKIYNIEMVRELMICVPLPKCEADFTALMTMVGFPPAYVG